MKRNYIGLSGSFRDAAICIVNAHGEIVHAEALERTLQYKRAFNVTPEPYARLQELISEYCNPHAELVFAHAWSDSATQALRREKARLQVGAQECESDEKCVSLAHRLQAGALFAIASQLSTLAQRGQGIEYALARLGARAGQKVIHRTFEHHLAHAATACYTSPFDAGVCAILDDLGEGRTAACYDYRDGELRVIDSKGSATNAGLAGFMELVCQLCGFDPMAGEAWKVMGLAPYGRPDDELLQLLRSLLNVDGLRIEFRPLAASLRALEQISPKRGEAGERIADFANAGQAVYTETLMVFLNHLHATSGSDHLAYGGECALNSAANGHILQNTAFRQLHVFSAPADDGNAIGAALLAFREDHPDHRFGAHAHTPYLGSCLSTQTLQDVMQFSGLSGLRRCSDAPAVAAQLLAQGKVIGWLQGAAEFGPRALGNRSILADPRVPGVKDMINARVKFREGFRPFAPAVLDNFGSEYFENYQSSPYMERTLRFNGVVRDRVLGVVHVDGTGRVQSVTPTSNPRFYQLIARFHELTGVPLVLNTSFNVMGKPIANTVEDALSVFYTSGLDALFMDDFLIEKTQDLR
ncbi:carbamoyltransferase family protein [Curvibacter delicatus]|jgi:carbamoyltransferase|uniref:carbamoyltransferase family protein n=1 Tax=Curvibacter delicatus TaxID=80879 RepID=UPI000834767D|nr:carbamoyltransferase C-terminal domain-containing protein [Curvibacter delicatus]